jgi:membrane associated rhomboid family serine protease
MGVLHKSELGNAIRGMYVRWAVYMLIFGLIPIFRVDNAAHIGGLVSGFGIAYLAGMPRRYASAGERGWQIAAYACLVLTALCFLKMFLWFQAAGK